MREIEIKVGDTFDIMKALISYCDVTKDKCYLVQRNVIQYDNVGDIDIMDDYEGEKLVKITITKVK